MTQPEPATSSAVAPAVVAAPAAGVTPVGVPQLVDGIAVDAVAAAVRTCPGVSDLYAGRFAEVGTYLPGRRVPGVTVADGILTVQVRARWGVPATVLLTHITGAVGSLRAGHRLNVIVADIDDPDEAAPVVTPTPPTPPTPRAQPALAVPSVVTPVPLTLPSSTNPSVVVDE